VVFSAIAWEAYRGLLGTGEVLIYAQAAIGASLVAFGGMSCALPIAAGGVGFSCIAELRTVETLAEGRASTPLLRHGDRVRIEMKDRQARSIFGAIEQTVARPNEV